MSPVYTPPYQGGGPVAWVSRGCHPEFCSSGSPYQGGGGSCSSSFRLSVSLDEVPLIRGIEGVVFYRQDLKRSLSLTQFGEGLFDEFGVRAAGIEVVVGGGPKFFGFPIPLQIP